MRGAYRLSTGGYDTLTYITLTGLSQLKLLPMPWAKSSMGLANFLDIGQCIKNKLRQVPRDLVCATMQELDPEGLERRKVRIKNKKRKECFTTRGPNWVHSVDGHNKLMGFQSDTFPLAIYGSVDTASRKLLWLCVWTTNKEPKLIGRWYLEYLFENKVMPSYLQMDRGTETGVMSTIHAFLHRHHEMDVDPTATVISHSDLWSFNS